MNAFRILIADDHQIFRLGLGALLGSHEGWEVCGEAANGRDAVQQCRRLRPDLVILDICMPELNGLDAARKIVKHNPSQRILILTDVDSDEVVRACLEVGVRGWVYKSDGAHELTTAVEALQRNNSSYSGRICDLIVDGYRRQHADSASVTPKPRLTLREREVVQLLAESKTAKEVAMILNVSLKTVETHRSNVMIKLNFHSVTELVLYAVRNEIVHVPLPNAAILPQPLNGQAVAFSAD